MKYDAVLFDLDGTLLPMDNDEFTKGYLDLLSEMAATSLGYDREAFLKATWKGVLSMVKNDGSRKNEEVFWNVISHLLGDKILEQIPVFDSFYRNEFHKTKAFTVPNPLAKEAIALARKLAPKVILATSPLFPTVAVHARMSWIDLDPELFDWITDYSNSYTCKPNPAYYLEICEKLNLDPKKCLMIGNNAQEDVEAGQAAGMDTFLVTDWLINQGKMPECPQGSFEDLIAYMKQLQE